MRLCRAEKKAATRESLLDAAERAFAERGFHGASVDDVAAAAGYTKGAVYAHFEGKEDLFLGMLERRFAARLDEVRRIVADGKSVEEQAHEAGDAFTAYLEEDPRWSLLFFEFWAHAVRNPKVARRLRDQYAAIRRGVAEAIAQRAAEAGIELEDGAESVALMTFAMANGVAVERMLEPDAVPHDLYGRMLAALFAGLRDDAGFSASASPAASSARA